MVHYVWRNSGSECYPKNGSFLTFLVNQKLRQIKSNIASYVAQQTLRKIYSSWKMHKLFQLFLIQKFLFYTLKMKFIVYEPKLNKYIEIFGEHTKFLKACWAT